MKKDEKPITPKVTIMQPFLGLKPVKELEVDGIGMGVLSDGTPYLTARGLARMCGVSPSVIIEMGSNWNAEQLKPRGTKIASLLAEQGFKGDSICLKITDGGREVSAFTDAACMAVLEYYAFETNFDGQATALRNFRLLARFSIRAFIYNRCGYDPNKSIPDSWQNFHERVLLNDQVPVGYFSVFREIADIVVHMIQSGCPIDDHTIPDASVGLHWGNVWAERKLEDVYGPRQKHPHNYPDWFPQSAANPIPAWIYPAHALGEFRIWLYDNYVRTNFPKYIEAKVKKGVFLPSGAQILIESVSRKELPAPPENPNPF